MSDQVIKRWIIVRHPGKIPIIKIPTNTCDGMVEMLKEIYDLYPEAQLTAVQLAYGNQLWVDDGKDYIDRIKVYEEALDDES